MADEKTKRGKKIARMTPEELNKQIGESRTKMGGEYSRYMKHLYARKAAINA